MASYTGPFSSSSSSSSPRLRTAPLPPPPSRPPVSSSFLSPRGSAPPRPPSLPSARHAEGADGQEDTSKLKGLPHIVVEGHSERRQSAAGEGRRAYPSTSSLAGEGRLVKGKIRVQGQLKVGGPGSLGMLEESYDVDNDVRLVGPRTFAPPSSSSSRHPGEKQSTARRRTRTPTTGPSSSSSSPGGVAPPQSILSSSSPSTQSSFERKKTRKNISFSADTIHAREARAASQERRRRKADEDEETSPARDKKWFNDPELTKLTDPPDRVYEVRNRIRVEGTCPLENYYALKQLVSQREGRGTGRWSDSNRRPFGKAFRDKKKKKKDEDDHPRELSFTADFVQEGEVLVNARDGLQRIKAEIERENLRQKLSNQFSEDLPGTLSGRLMEPYVRKAAYEMLNVSDMCEGHGWRVLEELRRLLVLRQGRVSLPWDREEESCRVCLAHLALLKRTFESAVIEGVRKECFMDSSLKRESPLFSSDRSGRYTSPSIKSQGEGEGGGGEGGEGGGSGLLERQGSKKKQVSFRLQADLSLPPYSGKRSQLNVLKRQTDLRHQWLKDLRKSLELATAYATKGRKQPAVFLRIAALKPLQVYRHLNSAEVRMVLVEVFQRLWMKFVEYSLKREVRVSTAALVLDCSFLTEYDCTSGAFHFLMKDLRDVVRAFCPLLIRRVIFFKYSQAHESIWQILRTAVENVCFFSFYDDDKDLASEVEGERPFIYHTMLLDKKDVSMLAQALPPMYAGICDEFYEGDLLSCPPPLPLPPTTMMTMAMSSSSAARSYLEGLLPLRYFRVSPKLPGTPAEETEEEQEILREACASSVGAGGVRPSSSVQFLENELRVFRFLAGNLVVLANAGLEPEVPGRDIFKEAVCTPEQMASSLAARIRGREEEAELRMDDFSVVLRLGERLSRLLTYKEAARFWKGLNDLRDVFVARKKARRAARRQAAAGEQGEQGEDEEEEEEEDDGGVIDPEGHLGPSEEALREAKRKVEEKKWREEDPTFQIEEERRRRRTFQIFDAVFARQDEVEASLAEASFEDIFEKSVADAVNERLRGEGFRVPPSPLQPSSILERVVTVASAGVSYIHRAIEEDASTASSCFGQKEFRPLPLDLVCRRRISPQVDQIYAEGFPGDLAKFFSVPQTHDAAKFPTMRMRA